MPDADPITICPADDGEGQLLLDMLLHAVSWDSRRADLSRRDVLATPELAHYVDHRPRPGDVEVVAVNPSGQAVGAAWLRQFAAGDPSYDYLGDQTPELSIGVRPEHRGRGVGTSLCRELLSTADAAGIARVSLSVEKANPAAALYARLGFVTVRDDGAAVTMIRQRHRAARCPAEAA